MLDPSLEDRLKYRVANVAAFLAEMNDSAFHSLTCIGYAEEPELCFEERQRAFFSSDG